MKPSVQIGPATIVGYFLTVLGIAGTIISAAGTNLHLSTETVALITAGIAGLTNVLRSWQAREIIRSGVKEVAKAAPAGKTKLG